MNTTVCLLNVQWSWKDVALECENVLGPLGYSAVQVCAATAMLLWMLQVPAVPFCAVYALRTAMLCMCCACSKNL